MQQKTCKKICIVAGEHSGDLLASLLVKELLKKDSSLSLFGIGGPQMKAAGVNLCYDLTDLAVVGFYEVLKHYPKIRRIFYGLLKTVKKERPDLIILVDYPGFNLRFAKKAKQQNLKIAYYISPQIWAWKKNRINLIKKYIDKMIVIFHFEKQLYAEKNIPADYVGHPLLDIIHPSLSEADFRKELTIDETTKIIGLLPGSRYGEIKKILPVMLQAAQIIKKTIPGLTIILPYRDTTLNLMENIINRYNVQLKLVKDNVYNTMFYADLLLVASGTATLESACALTPMIVVYKTSFFTWIIAKTLLTVPYIGMVNVVAGSKIVPEYIQYQATRDTLSRAAISLLKDEQQLQAITQALEKNVKNRLGDGGASQKAADILLAMV